MYDIGSLPSYGLDQFLLGGVESDAANTGSSSALSSAGAVENSLCASKARNRPHLSGNLLICATYSSSSPPTTSPWHGAATGMPLVMVSRDKRFDPGIIEEKSRTRRAG
jgi:hypothetical protein